MPKLTAIARPSQGMTPEAIQSLVHGMMRAGKADTEISKALRAHGAAYEDLVGYAIRNEVRLWV